MSVTMEQLNDILQAFNDHDLDKIMDAFAAVSYTHLTLPTILLV